MLGNQISKIILKLKITINNRYKGQKATIKVTYNAAVEGVFKKSVNVKFTNSNQPYILTLEGEVAAEAKVAKTKS